MDSMTAPDRLHKAAAGRVILPKILLGIAKRGVNWGCPIVSVPIATNLIEDWHSVHVLEFK